jgi:hypothetical protein
MATINLCVKDEQDNEVIFKVREDRLLRQLFESYALRSSLDAKQLIFRVRSTSQILSYHDGNKSYTECGLVDSEVLTLQD